MAFLKLIDPFVQLIFATNHPGRPRRDRFVSEKMLDSSCEAAGPFISKVGCFLGHGRTQDTGLANAVATAPDEIDSTSRTNGRIHHGDMKTNTPAPTIQART